jgi:diaminopimelate epimerase
MPDDIPFHKMHGIGNDFVVIAADAFARIPADVTEAAVRYLCDRNFGIGADGVLTYMPRPDGLVFCIFNADGSRDTMCGNGLRCVVSLLAADGRIPVKGIAKTDSGDVHYTYQSAQQVMLQLPAPQDFHAPITIGDFTFSCINTGSPHAVVLLPDGQGPNPVTFVSVSCDLENHVDFPSGISTNWVWRDTRGGLRLRTWERGVGETLACGTGTCAAGVAFIKAFPQEKTVTLTSEGGSLVVSWDGSPGDPVFLTGPAELVMQGTISIPDSVLTSQVGV